MTSTPVLTKGVAHLDVAAGQTFALELPETPGTGFRWHLETQLELVRSEFSPFESGRSGGGGIRRFVLTAPSPGQYRVDAVLRRGWEGDASRVDEVTATIDAR
jgi:predicted secreted protein